MKEMLWSQLRAARDSLVWKLDGLGEYDLRRPMTPTGTNLLGLAKHLGSQEYGKFGEVFGRPAPEQLACVADGSIWHYGDMWATPEESAEYIMGFYRRACAHADETIGALDLDTIGSVPWSQGEETTLGAMLLNMLGETQRHAGHIDIVRELIDGFAGGMPDASGFHEGADEQWWREYVDRLEAAARAAAAR
ncbi:DinB family protein [Actinopolymorpha pittospori]|uniref:DinB family protein n=1 Tax=Actinopolymorpha pittospori TaxID=648752 RepID=A0A927MYA2_9ACTN|nr:DinB family protein [Actinopolymorpha pittospori]MBE1608549.1 hypothetical protein [Actinopolymorpha pittospori]